MKKTGNIVLIIVLLALIGGLGFFSYKLLFSEDKVVVPDFTDKTREEIITWCNSFETNPCKFDNDYSDTIAEGKMIYQSISANNELGDSISFIISLGKKIEIKLPQVGTDTTKESIEKWKKDNNVINEIEYVEQYNNDAQAGIIFKIEPSVLTNTNDKIKVYISKGKEDDKNIADIEITYGTYINLNVSDFESKVKSLGLVPNHNTDRDDKSSKVEKGKIVWHGSGSYVKGETINYGICLEKTEGKIVEVKAKEYVGKTLDEFKKICEDLGLTPVHSEVYKDEYSDTIDKGCLDWHGYGSYDTADEEDRIIHYTLSLGKKEEGDEQYTLPADITKYQFAGKTLEEFRTIASKYGLTANYRSEWDDYSDTIPKGYILRNGEGSYTEDDTYISYGLSLGKKDGSGSSTYFEIKSGQYKGKTLDEFKTAVQALGLIPEHSEVNSDDYSDTVAKGCILWHGAADDFKAGEIIHYTVSLGKKSSDSSDSESQNQTVSISVNQYINLTEVEFKNKMSQLGLVAYHNTNKDTSSDSNIGIVVWHTSGEIAQGGTVSYGLSTGAATSSVMSYNDLTSYYEKTSFSGTKDAVIGYFTNTCGFLNSNITVNGQSSSYGEGKILSVTINGESLTVMKNYPTNSKVVVVICNEQR